MAQNGDSKSDLEQQFQQQNQSQLAAAANFASFYPFLFNKQKPSGMENMFSCLNYSPVDFRNPFLFPTSSNNANLKLNQS